MSSTVYLEQGGDSSEDALIVRLRRFVVDSILAFIKLHRGSELQAQF
jgi:hypothetical protein